MSSSKRTPTPAYMHTARGGAGNIAKTTPTMNTTTLLEPQSKPQPVQKQQLHRRLPPPPSTVFPTSRGRGGAGNMHHQSQSNHQCESSRTIFSFDEELAFQLRHESHLPPVYHVGRGGAGNIVQQQRQQRKDSETSSTSSTTSTTTSARSVESGADVATRNLRRGLEKGWGMVVGVGAGKGKGKGMI